MTDMKNPILSHLLLMSSQPATTEPFPSHINKTINTNLPEYYIWLQAAAINDIDRQMEDENENKNKNKKTTSSVDEKESDLRGKENDIVNSEPKIDDGSLKNCDGPPYTEKIDDVTPINDDISHEDETERENDHEDVQKSDLYPPGVSQVFQVSHGAQKPTNAIENQVSQVFQEVGKLEQYGIIDPAKNQPPKILTRHSKNPKRNHHLMV